MKTTKIIAFSLTLAALGLGGISPQALPAAFAQDGQDMQAPPPPMGQGGPGGFGGPGGGFGGPGGGGGRQGGMMMGNGRFATGTVSAVDAAAKTITVTSPFAGTQTIQVSDTTQVVSQATATVADLKVGDHVQVQGVPTGITASSLTIGENPLQAGQNGGRQGGAAGGGQGGFGGRQGGGFGGPGGQGGQQSFATATGAVTATSPLTIALSTSASLILKLAPSAKVTKYTTVALSGIKTGDQIVGTGQAGDNGVFAATTVGVNMQMGGGQGGFGGRGGFGGPGNFGGPGGQGGFRGGPAGQGGGGAPAADPNS